MAAAAAVPGVAAAARPGMGQAAVQPAAAAAPAQGNNQQIFQTFCQHSSLCPCMRVKMIFSMISVIRYFF